MTNNEWSELARLAEAAAQDDPLALVHFQRQATPAAILRLLAERDRLQAVVDEDLKGITIHFVEKRELKTQWWCCGEETEIVTPEAARAHVAVCDKHPMAALRQQLADAHEQLALWLEAWLEVVGSENGWNLIADTRKLLAASAVTGDETP